TRQSLDVPFAEGDRSGLCLLRGGGGGGVPDRLRGRGAPGPGSLDETSKGYRVAFVDGSDSSPYLAEYCDGITAAGRAGRRPRLRLCRLDQSNIVGAEAALTAMVEC